MADSREKFESHFTHYRVYLDEEIRRFHCLVAVYRNINERKRDSLEELNVAPAFFQVVGDALFTAIIMWADKLFDEKGERGLFNFLSYVEQNRKWLSVEELQRRRSYPDGHWMLRRWIPVTFESIEADRKRIQSLKVLASFRLRRDKFHGHFDKGYFFDRKRLTDEAPISWAELEEAGIVMGSVLNSYSAAYDGSCYSFDVANINDLDALLRKLKRAKGVSID